jgi:hypothetical protein
MMYLFLHSTFVFGSVIRAHLALRDHPKKVTHLWVGWSRLACQTGPPHPEKHEE